MLRFTLVEMNADISSIALLDMLLSDLGYIGGPQQANLGDGRGWVNQTAVIRFDYDNSFDGTCLESLIDT